MNKLLTIVVPVYNSKQYLDECVRSILNQTYGNFELILVDDGSLDESLSICHKWEKADERVKVIRQDNAGPGAARNKGIDIAQGDYIAFVDSDDTVSNIMYERMIGLAEKNDADMVCSNLCDMNDNKVDILVFDREEALIRRLTAQTISDSTVDKLYDRRLFDRLRYPTDRSISEDSALVYKLIASCNKVVCTNEKFYNIRLVDNSLSRSAYEGRFVSIIDTYEEMVAFFKSSGERDFEKIAINKATSAVLLNVGEYYCSNCRDKQVKKSIIDHARWQLKNYDLIFRNKVILLMALLNFNALGFIYKCKNKRK